MKLEPGDFAGFAEEDLEQMEYNAKDGFRLARSTCMHAQQYAEKMIKDRIVQIDSDEPPKTHDLVVLLRILKPSDGEIDEDILHKASILTYYYMGSRYPDFDIKEEMTEEAAEEAYRWSLEIVDYISRIVKDESGKLRIETITEEGRGDDSPRGDGFWFCRIPSLRVRSATGQGRHQGTFEVVHIDRPQLSEHACSADAVAAFGSVGAETAKKWLDQVMMEI